MRTPRILSAVISYSGAVQVIGAGANEIYCAVKIPGGQTVREIGRILRSEGHTKG